MKAYKDIWKELLSFAESNITKSPENRFISVSTGRPHQNSSKKFIIAK